MWAIMGFQGCDDEEDENHHGSMTSVYILVAANAKLDIKVRITVRWHGGLAEGWQGQWVVRER